MQKRLSKKARFFNNINFTADDEVYIGIDVHKINGKKHRKGDQDNRPNGGHLNYK